MEYQVIIETIQESFELERQKENVFVSDLGL